MHRNVRPTVVVAVAAKSDHRVPHNLHHHPRLPPLGGGGNPNDDHNGADDAASSSSFMASSQRDWTKFVDLPADPSLRLDDDDFFFQLIRQPTFLPPPIGKAADAADAADAACADAVDESPLASSSSSWHATASQKRRRFFHAVPKLSMSSSSSMMVTDDEEPAPEEGQRPGRRGTGGVGGGGRTVPIHVRKMEIELTQRRLPRYPSQTHRTRPSFYPLPPQQAAVSSSSGQVTMASGASASASAAPAAATAAASQRNSGAMEAKVRAFYRARIHTREERDRKRREEAEATKQRREKARAVKEEARAGRGRRHRRGRPADAAGAGPSAMSSSSSALLLSEGRRDVTGTSCSCGSDDDEYEEEEIIEYYDSEDDDDDEETAGIFYQDDHRKLQHVHSRNLEEAEREEKQRRDVAEQAAHQERAEQRRLLYWNAQTLAYKLEHYRVRLALYLIAKWATEDAQEAARQRGLPEEVAKTAQPNWDVSSQYKFLLDFHSDRSSLRECLFPAVVGIVDATTTTPSELLHEDDDADDEYDDEYDGYCESIDSSGKMTPRKPPSVTSLGSHSSLPSLPPASKMEELANSWRAKQPCGTSTDEIVPDYEKEEVYEPQIGVISPSLKALIVQAMTELRTRKAPEGHRTKFEPSFLEAVQVGMFTRLKEHVIEAMGTKALSTDKPLLPSQTWQRGVESVGMPKHDNTRSEPFMIFNEAAAMGKMKALKPQVTTNYNGLVGRYKYSDSNNNAHDDNCHNQDANTTKNIDDENMHKVIRTNYLTDMYVADHRKEKSSIWDAANLAEEQVHYDNLDDVQLPTEKCPIVKSNAKVLRGRELQDAIAQAVAEASWDRRYRLERPHAEQRIKTHCSCKYCHNANPYQTHAYRKKWLIQQGLYNDNRPEPPELTQRMDAEADMETALEQDGEGNRMNLEDESASHRPQEPDDQLDEVHSLMDEFHQNIENAGTDDNEQHVGVREVKEEIETHCDDEMDVEKAGTDEIEQDVSVREVKEEIETHCDDEELSELQNDAIHDENVDEALEDTRLSEDAEQNEFLPDGTLPSHDENKMVREHSPTAEYRELDEMESADLIPRTPPSGYMIDQQTPSSDKKIDQEVSGTPDTDAVCSASSDSDDMNTTRKSANNDQLKADAAPRTAVAVSSAFDTVSRNRRKKTFLYEFKSLLGLAEDDKHDTSTSARARRLRKEQQQKRQQAQRGLLGSHSSHSTSKGGVMGGKNLSLGLRPVLGGNGGGSRRSFRRHASLQPAKSVWTVGIPTVTATTIKTTASANSRATKHSDATTGNPGNNDMNGQESSPPRQPTEQAVSSSPENDGDERRNDVGIDESLAVGISEANLSDTATVDPSAHRQGMHCEGNIHDAMLRSAAATTAKEIGIGSEQDDDDDDDEGDMYYGTTLVV